MEFSPLGFLFENWVLLVVFVGFLLISQLNVHMERRMVGIMRMSLLLLVILAIVDYLESWTASFSYPTLGRIVLSAIGYSIRPAIFLLIIAMMHGKHPMLLAIPAVFNAVVCFSAVFTDLVFGYHADNSFYRGPLGFTPFVVGFFYLGFLCWKTSRYFRRGSLEGQNILLFIPLNAVGTLAISVLGEHPEVFNLSFAVNILLYYLFLHTQMTKRDQLTGLLNRQSYYSDVENLGGAITGVISIDMNALKWINDHKGHEAGDKALATISSCFLDCTSGNERVYRIGGDEFAILCLREKEEAVRQIADKIRERLTGTGYTCSLGCACRSSDENFEDLCRRADAEMYRDKANYYSEMGRDRRRR